MSPVRRILPPVLAVVVVAAAWWALVWQPRADEAAALGDRAHRTEVELAVARDRLAAGRAAAADPAALDERLARAQRALPDGPDLDGFVAAHATVAASAGVTVLTVATNGQADQVAPDGMAWSGVEVAVRGEPAAVEAYLAQLEAMERVVTVDRLTIAQEGGGQRSAALSLRIAHLGSTPAATVTDAAGQP